MSYTVQPRLDYCPKCHRRTVCVQRNGDKECYMCDYKLERKMATTLEGIPIYRIRAMKNGRYESLDIRLDELASAWGRWNGSEIYYTKDCSACKCFAHAFEVSFIEPRWNPAMVASESEDTVKGICLGGVAWKVLVNPNKPLRKCDSAGKKYREETTR